MGWFSRNKDKEQWNYDYSMDLIEKVQGKPAMSNDYPKSERQEFHSLLADIEPRFANIENSSHYGAIGPQTKKVVQEWQEKFGITADGEAGAVTIYAMELARSNGGRINDQMIKSVQQFERDTYGANNPHLAQTNITGDKDFGNLVSRDDARGLQNVQEARHDHGSSGDLCVMGSGTVSGFGVGCNGYEGKRHANADTFFGYNTFDPNMPIIAVPMRDIGVAGKPQPGDIVQLNYNGNTTYAVAYDIGGLNNKRGTDPRDFDLNASVMSDLGIKYNETRSGAITSVSQTDGAVTAKVIGSTDTAHFKQLQGKGPNQDIQGSRDLRAFAKNMLDVVDDLRDKNVSPAKAEAVVQARINEFYGQRPELAQAVGRGGEDAQYLASNGQSQETSRG